MCVPSQWYFTFKILQNINNYGILITKNHEHNSVLLHNIFISITLMKYL